MPRSITEVLPKYLYVADASFAAGVAVINTGISPIGNTILRITGFDWSLTSANTATASAVAADTQYIMSLSAGSQETTYAETNLIYQHQQALLFTTSGKGLVQCSGQVTFEPYYCALSTLTAFIAWGAIGSMNMRIRYENVGVSELDLLRLMQTRG